MESQQSKEKVAIVKYDGSSNSLRKALELCSGLDSLKANNRVLLKPNVLWGGTRAVPPFGRITTSTIVEYLLQILRDRGCTDIAIGEGTILNKEMGSMTTRGYEWSGIGKVAKRYGVRLVDFNSEPYEEVRLENIRAKISKSVMECDFLIDLPVLKAHTQTKISLGMKNLKGCLAMSSKQAFHRHGLNRLIALLNMRIRPSLTIIDGIYGLERGPDIVGAIPHRMDLIIAGKDVFSCDIVGAMVMGIQPDGVEHLKEFASLTGRTVSLDRVEASGGPINQLAQKFEWRRSNEEILRQAGITGVTIQEPGLSLCSGCMIIMGVLVAVLTKDSPGVVLDGLEICGGRDVKAKRESKKVFLIGDCAVSANKDLKDAVMVKGCPPPVVDTVMALVRKGLPQQKAFRILMSRLLKGIGTKLGVYDETFPAFGVCKAPEFDRKHF
jgi:uncharacterized protein (DUF362 family)